MRLPRPQTRRRGEAVVPMINVVFLLLVFFMMTSQIAPPAPIEITPPTATPERLADGEAMLFLSADGTPAFNDLRGDTVWPALAALSEGATLTIAADAALPVEDLARILSRLDSGLSIDLLVQP